MSKIESGENPPPASEKIYALAEQLELNADDLFALAQRVPEDLTDMAMRSQMPQILRASKDMTEADLQAMLAWAQKRANKQ